MKVDIAGIGAWGYGFSRYDELKALLIGNAERSPEPAKPAPDLIPPRERRRAPLAVRLAVEVADQTCEAAGVAPSEPASVFGLGMGDSSITDYLCRILAGDSKLVSPTRFHNSVHNAASGYWTISVGCRAPANAVSAHRWTFPLTLLESWVQCATEQRPVLCVVFDVPTPGPLHAVTPIDEPFGLGFLLRPGGAWSLRVADEPVDWPRLDNRSLAALYESNPAARGLALCEQLENGADPVRLPLSPSQSLRLSRE